ncbi:unnamed protein product [marine sediment metagenome]|uniref:Uncharacterized protein n=1 Tax=marine sediment metagenome TaxID=412755 RepID=X1LQ00_9ZZZZ
MSEVEEGIQQFNRLVAKAALIHPMTWCVKRQWPMWTRSLSGKECCTCEHFVANGGICDPL